MGTKRWLGLAAFAGLALLAGYDALAQTAPAQTPDASAGISRQVNLSPKEELTQSDGFLSRMESGRADVARELEQARAARDVVKTLCLNDKLNQIDVAIRSARERRQALEVAANRNDSDLSNHEFTILSVLRQRSDQLTAEAKQCIGQEAGFVGESAVTATVDTNLPQEDPSQYPSSEVIVQPPACTSCVK